MASWNRSAFPEGEKPAPKWGAEFAKCSKHSVGDVATCGKKSRSEEDKFVFQPPAEDEEASAVFDWNDGKDLPRQSFCKQPPVPVESKRTIYRFGQTNGRVSEHRQNSEAASKDFHSQRAVSQYRASILEGDFVDNSGSEEEIVFGGSKDRESTARASSNREKNVTRAEDIQKNDDSLGTVKGRISSPVNIMAP